MPYWGRGSVQNKAGTRLLGKTRALLLVLGWARDSMALVERVAET